MIYEVIVGNENAITLNSENVRQSLTICFLHPLLYLINSRQLFFSIFFLLSGELHGLFSHNMVVYLIRAKISQRYLKWCQNTGHPSEHYWNVLNYNKKARAPGGWIGQLFGHFARNSCS